MDDANEPIIALLQETPLTVVMHDVHTLLEYAQWRIGHDATTQELEAQRAKLTTLEARLSDLSRIQGGVHA
jgi:hypothetical protein